MRLPIVVVDETAVAEVHPTVAEAEASMEAYDVLDGIYRVYDADGTVLEARPLADDRVAILEGQESVRRPDELAEALRLYVQSVGVDRLGVSPAWLAQASTVDVAKAILDFEERWKQECRQGPLHAIIRRLRK